MRGRVKHFRPGEAPTFSCHVCGRRTRHVERDNLELCIECHELSGADNTHNDEATPPTDEQMVYYNGLLADAVKKGGDGKAIQEACTYIWIK